RVFFGVIQRPGVVRPSLSEAVKARPSAGPLYLENPMEKAKKELPMARSICWHCQSDIGGEYFCQQCVKVQPLSKEIDYFTALSLPRKLNIDTGKLETKYYEMSRAFHPDFYEGKTEMERAVSLANSATLNQAYHTLKDPIEP